MRGVFTIPVTPFDEMGKLDEISLRAVVDFCVEAGGHGIVSPVNASEFSSLSDDERKVISKIVVQQTNHRIPVVIGTSGVSAQVAVEFSKYAEDVGADAVIAMPPYVQKPNFDTVFRYYQAISDAISIPIFIQNYNLPIGYPLSPEFMVKMTKEIEHVKYIKEETIPPTHIITATLRIADEHLKGIFGGMAGRHLFNEISRGICGTMPACDVTDIHATIWNLSDAGEIEKAREIFNVLLPLLNMESLYGALVYKEVLKRRGIIRTTYVRNPKSALDSYDMAELDKIINLIQPLFKIKKMT